MTISQRSQPDIDLTEISTDMSEIRMDLSESDHVRMTFSGSCQKSDHVRMTISWTCQKCHSCQIQNLDWISGNDQKWRKCDPDG